MLLAIGSVKLTVLIGPSYVFEKSVEASAHGSVPVCPTQRGAHPVGGMVCADLIVLALQVTRTIHNGTYKNASYEKNDY